MQDDKDKFNKIKIEKKYAFNNLYKPSFKGNLYKPLFKRNLCYTSKKSNVFFNWPHINERIAETKNKENYEDLWVTEYYSITRGILSYYYHTDVRSLKVTTPDVYNIEESLGHFTIFKLSTYPYKRYIRTVVKVNNKSDSWYNLLEDMWARAKAAIDDDREIWAQAKVSINDDRKLWAIGQKGLEFCVFRFDVSRFENQKPDCFTNFEPLNLDLLNTGELDNIGVKYIKCNHNGIPRIALIKWRLDNPLHQPYIDHMLQYTRSRLP